MAVNMGLVLHMGLHIALSTTGQFLKSNLCKLNMCYQDSMMTVCVTAGHMCVLLDGICETYTRPSTNGRSMPQHAAACRSGRFLGLLVGFLKHAAACRSMLQHAAACRSELFFENSADAAAAADAAANADAA